MRRRVIVVVLDSAGVGALPDAAVYGDEGSATIPHLAASVGGLRLPTMERLGLGHVAEIAGVPPRAGPQGAHGRMAEVSAGKDSTTGHWELMGVILAGPFPTYPHGFPPDVIEPFERAIGRTVLGNVPASGTEIIARLGEEHLRTGSPIVYTSADSVFQVACHEAVVPLDTLYAWCHVAREQLTGPHAVSRVIARPFVGEPGAFVRTPNRRDFSLPPPQPTVLDALRGAGLEVWAVGKIEDLFAGRGVTQAIHTTSDMDGMRATEGAYARCRRGLVFTNLVDLDTKYGHRNDPLGYARDLEAIDARLADLLERLDDDTVLLVTADHGNDPTSASTDHSREYVPVLVAGADVRPADLGTRASFADLGATVAEVLGVGWSGAGASFASEIEGGGDA